MLLAPHVRSAEASRSVVAFFIVAGCVLALLIGAAQSSGSAESGVLEGHLKISSLRSAEPGDSGPSKPTAADYEAYPLLVLSSDGKRVVREITADGDGNYRVSLPPGNYVLDAKGRAPKRVRATPKKFTITANQTVRVDFELDTGIR